MNLLILSILKLHILIKPFFKAKKIKMIILILRFIESKRLAESHYDKNGTKVWCRNIYHRVLLQKK